MICPSVLIKLKEDFFMYEEHEPISTLVSATNHFDNECARNDNAMIRLLTSCDFVCNAVLFY